MNKRINIYLTEKQSRTLKQISQRYKVSLSTIAYYCVFSYMGVGLEQALNGDYLVKNGIKTSIKPKNTGWENLYKTTLSKIFTNALVIYVDKKEKEYIELELANHTRDAIGKFLAEQREQYYNYNDYVRNCTRMAKNKKFMEYLERISKQ